MTKHEPEKLCAATLADGERKCPHTGSLFTDGQWWCRTHDPGLKAERKKQLEVAKALKPMKDRWSFRFNRHMRRIASAAIKYCETKDDIELLNIEYLVLRFDQSRIKFFEELEETEKQLRKND